MNTLLSLAPGAQCDRIKPVVADAELPAGASLGDYDGVFLTRSPLHLYNQVEKRLVENFPQPFSHVALVNTVLIYNRAEGPARERSHD